jgi:molybdate transport system substrate-binding protein
MTRLLTLVCGVVAGASGAAAGGATSLSVSVAVSLQPAIEEAVREYRSDHPKLRVALNSGASGVLLQQARRGAPVDVFISASPLELDRLETAGRLRAGSRRDLASNELVVVVPRGTRVPTSVDDLRRAEYDLIAVGNPKTAPVGRYTEQALDTLDLDEVLGDRLVLAENARQLVDYVARGEVAAGLAYRTDAQLLADRLSVGAAVPPRAHSAVIYQGAVLSATAHPELAEGLLAFLVSAEGQRILRRFGFLPPP